MPERFLLQILRNLVNHGILKSTRGVDGGYSLLRPAEEISILDIIEAIDGPMHTDMSLSEGLSQESQQRLKGALEEITTTTRDQLMSIKLSQLLRLPPDE